MVVMIFTKQISKRLKWWSIALTEGNGYTIPKESLAEIDFWLLRNKT